MKGIDQNPAVIFVAAVTKWVVKQYFRVVVREALKGLFIIDCTMIWLKTKERSMKSMIKWDNLKISKSVHDW